MATKNNSKSTPKTAKVPVKFKRLGLAVRPADYAIIARLEARWFPERSEWFRPSVSDVVRRALEVAEKSGI